MRLGSKVVSGHGVRKAGKGTRGGGQNAEKVVGGQGRMRFKTEARTPGLLASYLEDCEFSCCFHNTATVAVHCCCRNTDPHRGLYRLHIESSPQTNVGACPSSLSVYSAISASATGLCDEFKVLATF